VQVQGTTGHEALTAVGDAGTQAEVQFLRLAEDLARAPGGSAAGTIAQEFLAHRRAIAAAPARTDLPIAPMQEVPQPARSGSVFERLGQRTHPPTPPPPQPPAPQLHDPPPPPPLTQPESDRLLRTEQNVEQIARLLHRVVQERSERSLRITAPPRPAAEAPGARDSEASSAQRLARGRDGDRPRHRTPSPRREGERRRTRSPPIERRTSALDRLHPQIVPRAAGAPTPDLHPRDALSRNDCTVAHTHLLHPPGA